MWQSARAGEAATEGELVVRSDAEEAQSRRGAEEKEEQADIKSTDLNLAGG